MAEPTYLLVTPTSQHDIVNRQAPLPQDVLLSPVWSQPNQ